VKGPCEDDPDDDAGDEVGEEKHRSDHSSAWHIYLSIPVPSVLHTSL
jgi:hypothetical protein